MEEVLRTATWCDPRCAQDHLDIVDAVRARRPGPRPRADQRARRPVEDHDAPRDGREPARASGPRFVTPGRFAGKVVVVTGAAQGIGEAVARRISAEGGTLVLADRSEHRARAGRRSWPRGADAVAVVADLETWDGAERRRRRRWRGSAAIDVLDPQRRRRDQGFKPFTELPAERDQAEIDRSL